MDFNSDKNKSAGKWSTNCNSVRLGEDILDDVIFFTVTLIIVQLGYFNTNRKT